jgi:hypothetical protein
MTVAELIAELQKLDADLIVYTNDAEFGEVAAERVRADNILGRVVID